MYSYPNWFVQYYSHSSLAAFTAVKRQQYSSFSGVRRRISDSLLRLHIAATMDLDDAFWEAELNCDNGKDRRWIIPDKEELNPPEGINNSENEAFIFCRICRILQNPHDNVSKSVANGISVRILEERGRGVWDAVGGEVWEAALLLAIWLRLNLSHLNSSHAMEVGCGVALPSLYLAESMAFEVSSAANLQLTLSDHDVCLLKNLETNLTMLPRAPIHQDADDSPFSIARSQILNLAKLDWSLFTSERTNDDYDILLPPSLLRTKFDILFGSALCYAPYHKCLAFMFRYYLSGCCREIIVIQVSDREGFQELLQALRELNIYYSLEEVPQYVYEAACRINTSKQSLVGSSGEMDSVQKFIDYNFPSIEIESSDLVYDSVSSIRTKREAFALLRISKL